MNYEQKFELRERAIEILGLSKTYDPADLKKAYNRLIKKFHPDNPRGSINRISNEDLAKLIIQAYNYLKGKNLTSMLENDEIVFQLTGQRIPFKEIKDRDNKWDASKFYDSFNNSIWPESPKETKYKFGGIC